MRMSSWTPSIVPDRADQTVYLVESDFGGLGRAFAETDCEHADLETTITALLEGQYNHPVRVVAFNTAERWSEDVSEDIAHELRRRCDLQLRDVPSAVQDFVEGHEGHHRQLACGWCDPCPSSPRSSPPSAPRVDILASSNRRWRRRSKRCQSVSDGSTKSSSMAIASRCTSLTRP
jgi:hypothetical protein